MQDHHRIQFSLIARCLTPLRRVKTYTLDLKPLRSDLRIKDPQDHLKAPVILKCLLFKLSTCFLVMNSPICLKNL